MAKVSMPQLGESVTEGTIGRWLKQPGESVEKYEPLVEVTTDKVNAEVPSPFAGTLQEISAQEGETVNVGAQIAVIVAAGEEVAAPAAGDAGAAQIEAVPAPAPVTNQGAGEAAGPAGGVAAADEASWPLDQTVSRAAAAEPQFGSATGGVGAEGTPDEAVGDGEPGARAGRRRFTPLVLRLAEGHNIPLEELGRIEGTGLGGRISKNDVLRYVETRGVAAPAQRPEGTQPVAPAPPAPPAPPSVPLPAAPPAPATVAQPVQPDLRPAAGAEPATAGEMVPLTPMRRAIAEHMTRSLATAPHAWTTVEVDMTALARYRAARKDEFARREGFPLSFVPFFIEAVVGALKEFPVLNSTFTEGGIQLKREINIGVAVALEGQQGLVVPTIKGADARNIVGLARALNDLVTRARSNRLTLDDMQGGTFTVNNPGTFGSILSQPIINQPQAAILTMEAIVKRPVVLDDEDGDLIAIRQMMNICLSFDHRILDGLTAGQFLAAIKRRLEGPPGGLEW